MRTDGKTEKLRQTNRYDGEGLRYETEENGKVIRFLFDRGELAQESREEEKISYARGHQLISLSRSGKERNYFVQDEMGSTMFLLDYNHEIRKTYRYDAFGNILKKTGDISNSLTYTGQMYDGIAGQYYLRARFYNPAIGRFLQEDTYRGDGLNLYAYCANNPVMYYDPSGYGLSPNGKTYPANDNSETDSYTRTDPVTVSGERAIDQGHSYESGVRDLYENVSFAQRQYEAKLNGQTVNGVADNVVLDQNIAIEAKYVEDWTTSLRNPESQNGTKPWAVAEQDNMLY